MDYVVNFLGGRRVVIDHEDFHRMSRRVRNMGNMVYVPLKDGSQVFYKNMTYVHRAEFKNDPENSEYVIVFRDDSRLGITSREYREMTNAVKALMIVPAILLRTDVLIVRDNIGLICPHGSRLIDAEPEADVPKVEKACCDNPVVELRYVTSGNAKMFTYQCINCKKKSRFIPKSSVKNPDAVLPALE